jgi:hypothetical protein
MFLTGLMGSFVGFQDLCYMNIFLNNSKHKKSNTICRVLFHLQIEDEAWFSQHEYQQISANTIMSGREDNVCM